MQHITNRVFLLLTLIIALSSPEIAVAQQEKAQDRDLRRQRPAQLPVRVNPLRINTLGSAPKKAHNRKLDSGLRRDISAIAEAGVESGTAARQVTVVVRPNATEEIEELKTALRNKGAEILRSNKNSIKARIPLSQIETASELPQLRYMRKLHPPRKKAFTAQGVSSTQADSWHALGFSGVGTHVAVIDTGFMSLPALTAAGEIPADYIAVNFSADPDIGDSDAHGSACAEIVHDIAPAAKLHLIKVDDISDMPEVANYCITAGVDIVSFSLGFDILNFHDGIAYENWYSDINDHPVTVVDQINAADILFVASAGNEQQSHAVNNWGDSEWYMIWDEEDYDYNMLFYGEEDYNFPVGAYIAVMMTWNQWPLSNEDYDLYLYHYDEINDSWDSVASSTEIQNGDQYSYPMEELAHVTTEAGIYAVVVARESVNITNPDFLFRHYGIAYPYYWRYNDYTNPAPGSIAIPADAASAFTIGAVDFINYTNGPVDYYSSLGPNNRAFTGGEAVLKPDLCAPAGTTSVAYDNYAFYGTSASAPHIAGLAALVKSVYPFFTVEQTKTYLRKFCLDIDPAGADNASGAGTAQLPTLLTIIEGEALQATAVMQSGGGAQLQFTGLAGEQYNVMAKDSLLSAEWQLLGTATVDPNGTAVYNDTAPLPPSRFYKLVKP